MSAKERTHLVDFYVKHFACECCIPDLLVTLIEIAISMQPFQWELKRQPGAMSPARGGFRPDDPNQQILADEDIYDEYGGMPPYFIQWFQSFHFLRHSFYYRLLNLRCLNSRTLLLDFHIKTCMVCMYDYICRVLGWGWR
jgi:hypothetical protein